MQNLIYSLQVTLPVFLILLLGFVLRKRNVISQAYVESSNRLTFRVLLPIMIFNNTRSSNFQGLSDAGIIIYGICFLIAFPLLLWLICRRIIPRRKLGTFVQGCFRGNAMVIGLSLAQNIYGNNLGAMSLLLSFTMVLFNVVSVSILCFSGDSEQNSGSRIRSAGIQILRNRIIWGSLLGLACSIWGITFPGPIEKTLTNLGGIATAVSLIAAGGGFVLDDFRKNWVYVCLASAIKLFLMPALCLLGAYSLGFRGVDLFGSLVISGVSTATTSVVMARELSGDEGLAVSILGTTTLCAAGSLTLWVYVLQSLRLL